MGEDMVESLDTADFDVDIPDDVPDDIADDIPEDIPEDLPEDDIPEDDIPEDDIPEDDIPEDDIRENDIPENDISEDIPADVSEDMPEDATTDDLYDGDTPNDIPEDVYSDGVDTEDDGEANDVPKEIPEDVPADADLNDPASADATTDDTVDDQSDVPADETTDDQSDVPADEATDDQSDAPADEATDDQSDAPVDEATDDQSDVPADEATDDQSDVPADEATDDQSDVPADAVADDQSDVPAGEAADDQSDVPADEATDDQSDAPADEATDDQSDAPADEATDDQSDAPADEAPDDQSDVPADEAADDQSDVPSDEAADDQSDVPADEATDDQSDVPADEAVDNQGDVPADEADNAQLKNSKNDSPEYRMDNFDNPDISSDSFNSLSDYMNAHNYGPDDFATYSQDPEWRILHREAFPNYELPPLTQENAYNQLSDYMNTHNYGPDDFAAYSQDPIWRELHGAAFPDYELPEMTQESANAQLSQYMNAHNYEVDDYAEYSQDPIWRELHSTAFPDDELPPLQNMSEDEFTESSESGIPQSADTVNAEMAESAFNQELGREFEENILSDPELTPEQKELMLGNYDEANRSDISTENAEVQTGDLMSDILKPSHFDDTDSVSDIQEASPFNNAMEKSNSVIDRYEKVRNNTALMNDETGYQIAMNEMSKDLETQVTDIGLAISENDAAVKVAEEALRNYSPEMETSPLNDSKYRELVENLQNTRDQSNRLRSKKGYLESLKNEASAEVSNEFKEMTFRSPGGKSFTDTFSELINEQGAAYPDEIVNDCGVCTMGNMANQHGGKFTEKSGLSTGFGEYNYTQITDEMSPDEKAYALDHNGLTSLDSQANILNKMGYEAVKYENGASFDDIVDNISKGNSMSLNLYGRDLNSGSDIAKRPGRIAAALSGQQSVLPANHAVTIAGLAVNPSGKPIGFFVNDTGGYGGKNNPSIFVSKAKYDQMLKRTAGISSIVCTGKKVFA